MKSLKFNGSALEYFKIWIVNILLTIITLGIYYPWAKVRNNRYLYANSILDDRNFEYHATGKQLFIGYLIAVVLFVTYNVINELFPSISIILLAVLLISIPWLIWRSMKFNMNVTSFSNVHFKFTGGLGQAYITFFVYPLLFILLSIGIFTLITIINNEFSILLGMIAMISLYVYAMSYFSVKKTNYLINFSRYGQGEFKTNLEVKEFVKIMLKTIFVSLTTLVISLILVGFIYYFTISELGIFNDLIVNKNDPKAMMNILGTIVPFIILAYFIMLCISFISFAYYITRQREYVFKNTNLDEKIEFNSTIKFSTLAFIIITNLIAIICTLGLAIPWAKVRMTRYILENTQVTAKDSITTYINEKRNTESAIGEEIGDVFDVDVAIPL